jgi:hypothetical protein
MDNPRIYLWIGVALLLWMNVIQWNRDYGAAPVAATTPVASTDPAAVAAAEEQAANAQLPSIPTGNVAAQAAGADPGVPAAPATATQPSIRVVTDVLDLDISLQGGDFVRADLVQYPRDKRPGSPPVRLFGTQEPDYSVARSGLRALNGRPEPTHLAVFTSTAAEFRMAPGASELRVPLSWTDGQGVTVTKTYVFRPGSYAIGIEYEVDNRSGDGLVGRLLRAARAARVRPGSLDVRRRELRVPRSRDLGRQQVPQARHRRQGRRPLRAERHRRLDGDDAAPLRQCRRAAEGRGVPRHARARRHARAADASRAAQGRARPARSGASARRSSWDPSCRNS